MRISDWSSDVCSSDLRIVFSGAPGRYSVLFSLDPEPVGQAYFVVIESTCGNRIHDPTDAAEALGAVVERAVRRGGTVIIPAFAVGRAQALFYYLWKLREAGRLKNIPIYLDSPMAINATDMLCEYLADHRLTPEVCRASCDIATYTREVEQSKAIRARPYPKIVISANGMATGGRVLHHLKERSEEHKSELNSRH